MSAGLQCRAEVGKGYYLVVFKDEVAQSFNIGFSFHNTTAGKNTLEQASSTLERLELGVTPKIKGTGLSSVSATGRWSITRPTLYAIISPTNIRIATVAQGKVSGSQSREKELIALDGGREREFIATDLICAATEAKYVCLCDTSKVA